MSTEIDWYVYRGQQRWGPYSWQQMVELVQQGNIKPNDRLWHPEYPNFVDADRVPGLFQVFTPNSSATPLAIQSGNQVQCPNCGGYRISQDIDRIDPTTGNKVRSGGCGVAVLFSIIAIALACYGTATENSVIGFSGTLLMILVGLPLIIWFQIKKEQAQKRAYNLYRYQCSLCGYQWKWQEGQPRPKINVRPDLIEKGEQRLEEEQRKQREDVAALYHLTHKK